MLKTNKLALSLLISGLLAGCANIDDSYQASKLDFKQYEEITQQYNIKENWWTLYNDVQLNRVIEQALTNNKDLARAAIAVNSALYSANLVGANLVPSFSASTSSTASKNIETGGNSTINHGGSLNVSYTLDLWRRLADAANAAEWTHAATEQDMHATRLSLINATVVTYYQISYLIDAIAAAEDNIKYYTQINNIMQTRLAQGIADAASTDQAQQAVLQARNVLINYQTQKKTAEQTLRNLLNLKPSEPLNIQFPHILDVKTTKVNLNVPVSTIANRPDVKGNQYRLNSAFKDAKAMQKSWFPSITLGASLASNGNKVDNAFCYLKGHLSNSNSKKMININDDQLNALLGAIMRVSSKETKDNYFTDEKILNIENINKNEKILDEILDEIFNGTNISQKYILRARKEVYFNNKLLIEKRLLEYNLEKYNVDISSKEFFYKNLENIKKMETGLENFEISWYILDTILKSILEEVNKCGNIN